MHQRVHETCGANNLFDHLAAAFLQFIRPRSCRDKQRLMDPRFPFVETQGTVIQSAGQTETMFDQRQFPAVVTGKHTANLRDSDMRFIHD
ncbi:hypothetical protein HRbin36_00515 [bacterium HR36]|nr:hypothetical protein HRbin36_00515 [bacterium HR36]